MLGCLVLDYVGPCELFGRGDSCRLIVLAQNIVCTLACLPALAQPQKQPCFGICSKNDNPVAACEHWTGEAELPLLYLKSFWK